MSESPTTGNADVLDPTSAAAPDWSTLTFHPHCPLCEYDLFGLATPRCPECGYSFEWPQVLIQLSDDHPYLFEYHAERNIRSYFQTAWHALFPRRFWSTLHPAQVPRVRRLTIYWLIGASLFTLAMMARAIALCAMAYAPFSSGVVYWPSYSSYPIGALEGVMLAWDSALSRIALDSVFYLHTLLHVCAPICIWPVLMLLVLSSFRISMKRSRIKTAHVARCVIYAFDPLGWRAAVCLLVLYSVILIAIKWPNLWDPRHEYYVTMVWACYALYRLYVAYKRYLRFEHPLATVVAAFVIVALIYGNVFPEVLNSWTLLLLQGIAY